MIANRLKHWTLCNKRIIVRADLNVPLENGVIANDFRLEKIQPTLDFILQNQGSIILLTHLGRPDHPTPELSTQCLMPWFLERSYPICWAATLEQADKLGKNNSIVLVENLRFFPEEKKQDWHFAKKIAQLGDYFVNDAFGSLHNNDTSITLVPEFFPVEKKSIGFLVEQELQTLLPLAQNPPRSFAIILGGAKIAKKIPYIDQLRKKASTIMIAPALSLTFSYTIGYEVGTSLIDKSLKDVCLDILVDSKKNGSQLLLPHDYQIELPDNTLDSVAYNKIPKDARAVSIGPKTIALWTECIQQAEVTLFNGTIGFSDWPETQKGMLALMQAMIDSPTTTIVTGGDSVAVVQQYNLAQSINFLSTGGGATLHLLSYGALPGLTALLKNGTKT